MLKWMNRSSLLRNKGLRAGRLCIFPKALQDLHPSLLLVLDDLQNACLLLNRLLLRFNSLLQLSNSRRERICFALLRLVPLSKLESLAGDCLVDDCDLPLHGFHLFVLLVLFLPSAHLIRTLKIDTVLNPRAFNDSGLCLRLLVLALFRCFFLVDQL